MARNNFIGQFNENKSQDSLFPRSAITASHDPIWPCFCDHTLKSTAMIGRADNSLCPNILNGFIITKLYGILKNICWLRLDVVNNKDITIASWETVPSEFCWYHTCQGCSLNNASIWGWILSQNSKQFGVKIAGLMKISYIKINKQQIFTNIANRFLEVMPKELMLGDNGHSRGVSCDLYTD